MELESYMIILWFRQDDKAFPNYVFYQVDKAGRHNYLNLSYPSGVRAFSFEIKAVSADVLQADYHNYLLSIYDNPPEGHKPECTGGTISSSNHLTYSRQSRS